MQFIQSYSKEIVTILAVFVAFTLNRYLKPRAKLIYSVRHATTLLVEEPLKDADGKEIAPRQFIHTASISVSNVGKETAKNVEITFNWKPQFLNVWPARHFEEKASQHDRHTIVLDSMSPSEIFGIELFSINKGLPGTTVVRSDECEASKVDMEPSVIQPRWKILVAGFLMLAGFASVIYTTAFAFQALVAR